MEARTGPEQVISFCRRSEIDMKSAALFSAGVLTAALLVASGSGPAAAGPSCTRDSVREVVASFVAAYNQGELDVLDTMFARGDRFQEYRVLPLERHWPESANRQSLLAYFKQRYQQGDHFILNDLEVGRAKGGGFWFRAYLERQSNDIRPWASGDYVPQKSGVTPNCKIRLFRIEWNGP